MNRTILIALLTLLVCETFLPTATAQSEPKIFASGLTDSTGREISYFGTDAEDGTLIFDANNGFFDAGSFRGGSQQDAPPADKPFISAHFGSLSYVAKQPGGQARWHWWNEQPGTAQVEFYLDVPATEAGSQWQIDCGGKSQTVMTKASSAKEPQPWKLNLKFDERGKQMLSFKKIDNRRTPKTQLHQIKLTGTAVQDAKLIRARWRPAAVHTSFESSSCSEPTTWVFESQNACDYSNYSPITTPFGYFGATFNADGTAAGGINFSMWAANDKATTAPPLESMPRLIATGNPAAEFGGFGHEGSGVKIRNWEPYAHHPKSVIQALRMESKDGIITFYGYLFDERINRWVLYAAAKQPAKNMKRKQSLWANSFCEVPGPPISERTGDQQRVVKRRGWFFGDDQNWHVVDRQKLSDKPENTNRFVGVTDDGWFTMGTGGVEMMLAEKEVRLKSPPKKLPNYLQPAIASQLFDLPVEFNSHRAVEVKRGSAVIEYDLKKAGTDATASVYFGTVDCLTFVKRDLHGTEKKGVSDQMLSDDRTWANQTPPQAVVDGSNKFSVTGLKPNTQYFYQILVTNKEGKSWDYESGSFKTAPQ